MPQERCGTFHSLPGTLTSTSTRRTKRHESRIVSKRRGIIHENSQQLADAACRVRAKGPSTESLRLSSGRPADASAPFVDSLYHSGRARNKIRSSLRRPSVSSTIIRLSRNFAAFAERDKESEPSSCIHESEENNRFPLVKERQRLGAVPRNFSDFLSQEYNSRRCMLRDDAFLWTQTLTSSPRMRYED